MRTLREVKEIRVSLTGDRSADLLHSCKCNRIARIITSLYTQIPQAHDEMRSNDVALTQRASYARCKNRTAFNYTAGTIHSYNLNATRLHLHVKGEYDRLCYPVHTNEAVAMIARRSYNWNTREITRMWFSRIRNSYAKYPGPFLSPCSPSPDMNPRAKMRKSNPRVNKYARFSTTRGSMTVAIG